MCCENRTQRAHSLAYTARADEIASINQWGWGGGRGRGGGGGVGWGGEWVGCITVQQLLFGVVTRELQSESVAYNITTAAAAAAAAAPPPPPPTTTTTTTTDDDDDDDIFIKSKPLA